MGIAAKPEIWRERLQHLKELGCNAIRAAHHTFAEEFIDLCDEMGFMCMRNVLINGRAGFMADILSRNGSLIWMLG